MVKYGRSEPRTVASEDAVVCGRPLTADDSGNGESNDEGFDDSDIDDECVKDGISDAASGVQTQVSAYTRTTASCGQEKEAFPLKRSVVDDDEGESATTSEEADLSAAVAGAETAESAYRSTTVGCNEEKGKVSPSKKRAWLASEEELESVDASKDADISATISTSQTTVSAYDCTTKTCGAEDDESPPAKRARRAANEDDIDYAVIDEEAVISRAAVGADTHAAEYVSTTADFGEEKQAQLSRALRAFLADLSADNSQAAHTDVYDSVPKTGREREICNVDGAAYQSLADSYSDDAESEYASDECYDDDEWNIFQMPLGDANGSWLGLSVCLTGEGLLLDVNWG